VFDTYRDKYENVRMKREDGILEVALHSGGGPLVFNGYVHEALVGALSLARAVNDERLSAEILKSAAVEAKARLG
jgi:hypothetical protein